MFFTIKIIYIGSSLGYLMDFSHLFVAKIVSLIEKTENSKLKNPFQKSSMIALLCMLVLHWQNLFINSNESLKRQTEDFRDGNTRTTYAVWKEGLVLHLSSVKRCENREHSLTMYHCTADLLFDWFGFNQASKYATNSA